MESKRTIATGTIADYCVTNSFDGSVDFAAVASCRWATSGARSCYCEMRICWLTNVGSSVDELQHAIDVASSTTICAEMLRRSTARITAVAQPPSPECYMFKPCGLASS